VEFVTAPVGRSWTLFDVAPSAMLNDGTFTIPAGELVSVTKTPPGGAGLSRAIVTSTVDPLTTVCGFTLTELRLAAAAATENEARARAAARRKARPMPPRSLPTLSRSFDEGLLIERSFTNQRDSPERRTVNKVTASEARIPYQRYRRLRRRCLYVHVITLNGGLFVTYGVVNDGATPTSGATNDGSYIAMARH
jgi:hypothetical protein